jgi:hypothetical protein
VKFAKKSQNEMAVNQMSESEIKFYFGFSEREIREN